MAFKKSKEIPIGGIGIIEGYKVMAKEYKHTDSCDACCFSKTAGYHQKCPMSKCFPDKRDDKKHVYFVISEEGGNK